MKLVPFLVALLALGYLSPLVAGTIQCVPNQGCPKGSKPPDCCQPPPCEFFEQIKMKQAVRRLYRRAAVNQRLIKQAGGDNSEAARLLDEWVKNKASNLGSQLRCKWEAPYGYAASFETKSWCEIFARLSDKEQESMSERQAHEKFDTCAEFISASYVHEGHHKQICEHTDSTKRMNEGLKVFAKEESDGYRMEIASLKADLKRYWRACSTVADAATARKVAAAGVSILKKKGPKKPRKVTQNPPAMLAEVRQ
jgi:hypothetical protein